MPGNKRSLGTHGEKAACHFLLQKGYKILKCNYRFGKLGEIDIIARENEYICFIEVKTRTSTIFGTPSEAVNYKKRKSIINIAQIYMKQHGIMGMNVRFDIIEVFADKNSSDFNVKEINLIKNAF